MDYEYEMRIQVKRESEKRAQELAPKIAATMAESKAESMAVELAAKHNRELVEKKLRQGKNPVEIADFLEIPLEEVLEIQKTL